MRTVCVELFILLAAPVVLGCSGDDDESCDGLLYPGAYVNGFSVDSQGRGFIDLAIVYGDACTQTVESRLVSVDLSDWTSSTRAVAPDVAAFGAAQNSVATLSPATALVASPVVGGVARVTPTEIAPIVLPSAVLDVDLGPDGWLVSMGSGGSAWITSSGAVSTLGTGFSECGSRIVNGFLVCRNQSLEVFDSAFSIISTLPLEGLPTQVRTGAGTSIAIVGTAGIAVVNASITTRFSFGDPATRVWVSEDGTFFVAQGNERLHGSLTSSSAGLLSFADTLGANEQAVTDVAFVAGTALVLAPGGFSPSSGAGVTFWNLTTGLPVGTRSWNAVFADPLPGRGFAIAFSQRIAPLRRGDVLESLVCVNDILGETSEGCLDVALSD